MRRMVAVCMFLAYLIGIGTGMCLKVLGVNAFPVEEFVPETEPEREFPSKSVPEPETEGTVAPTETEPETAQIRYYSVNGAKLSETLQDYLYKQLKARGHEEIFKIALCQIYQESAYDSRAISPNGLDRGLCQLRVTYFDYFAQKSGLVEWDIFNPIDSIYVYAYVMSDYLERTGDVATALSMYFMGPGSHFCPEYVNDVMKWMKTIKEA